MAKHYLNVLTVTLRSHSGNPAPETLDEAVSLAVDVGAELDLDELTDQIRQDVAPPRYITQTYRETTWGASGSGADIVIAVSSMMLGTGASLITIWDKVSEHVRQHGQPRTHAAATPADSARAAMAENLNVPPGEIRVTGLGTTEAGHRVRLDTAHGQFTVEIDDSGLTSIRRQGR